MNTMLAHGRELLYLPAGWIIALPLAGIARFFAEHFSVTGGNVCRLIARGFAILTFCVSAVLLGLLLWNNCPRRPTALDVLGVFVACFLPACVAYGPAIVLAVLALRTTRRLPKPVTHPECGKCGYNLTGNVSGTCPECGSSVSNAKRPQEHGWRTWRWGERSSGTQLMVGGEREQIRVFLVGSYRDTLEIYITPRDSAGLTLLVDAFLSLAERRSNLVKLFDLPNIVSKGLEGLDLKLGPDELSPFRMEHMEATYTPGLQLTWIESAETWLDCHDKVKMLLEPGAAGHQNLECGYETVIVSFGEESYSATPACSPRQP